MGGGVVVTRKKIMHSVLLLILTTLSFAKNRKSYIQVPGSIPGLPTNYRFVLGIYIFKESSYCEVILFD